MSIRGHDRKAALSRLTVYGAASAYALLIGILGYALIRVTGASMPPSPSYMIGFVSLILIAAGSQTTRAGFLGLALATVSEETHRALRLLMEAGAVVVLAGFCLQAGGMLTLVSVAMPITTGGPS